MAGDLPRRPEDEGVGLGAADQVLDAPERDQVDGAGVRVGDGPRVARRRADEGVGSAAADDFTDAGHAARAGGRSGRQVDGHGEGGRGVVECVHTAPAVDPTGHAAAGKDEAVAVLPTDEVLDASERLTIERTGADTGEGPGVRGVGADQGVIAEAAGNDTAQAAASGPYKGIGGGPAREVLDAGERLAVQSPGVGAIDDPGVGRVGADQRVVPPATVDDAAQPAVSGHREGVRAVSASEVLDPGEGQWRERPGGEGAGIRACDGPEVGQAGPHQRVIPGAADDSVDPAEDAVVVRIDDGAGDDHVPLRSQGDRQVAGLVGQVENRGSRVGVVYRRGR